MVYIRYPCARSPYGWITSPLSRSFAEYDTNLHTPRSGSASSAAASPTTAQRDTAVLLYWRSLETHGSRSAHGHDRSETSRIRLPSTRCAANNTSTMNFQDVILTLQTYWGRQGCALLQPYDMEVGAGTFHTATFLRALGPEPWRAAYVQPSRRPKDGRYGDNPNRLQHYYQYPGRAQALARRHPGAAISTRCASSASITRANDIRFVEDDWESPTLGAWGLGWEVWLNGMEVTQFTYFQEVGSLPCKPVLGEITYGLERLAMYLQGKDNVYDLVVGTTGDHLRRRLPPERSRAVDLQLRAIQRADAVRALQPVRARSQAPDREPACRCRATRW